MAADEITSQTPSEMPAHAAGPGVPTPVLQTAAGAGEGQVFAGRFVAQAVLKRHGSVCTLLGRDQDTGQSVVIKTLGGESLSVAAQMRLDHEAELLRKVDHRLLVPPLRVGREHGVFYLIAPYQAGETLEAMLLQRRLSVLTALQVGQGLLAGLQAIHHHGVLHRNVKPANVIVDLQATPLRAILIDTGLAHTFDLDGRAGDQSLQTVRYLAPEQAGLLDADVAEYSDLYSAGIVLFECLAGRPPFTGRTVHEVLRQQMTLQPAELRSLGVAVPRTLDEVLQRLLRKDPRERYQTARAVAEDLARLAAALQRGETEPAFVVGLHDQRTALTEPAFLGRDRELRLLDEQWQQVRQSPGGLVFVEAESGGGKTRLLSEWAVSLTRRDAWVLRGQASAQVGQRPFQVLEGITDEILSATSAAPELAAALRAQLGDSREAVAAVLPRLSVILGTQPSRNAGPEAFGENRSIDALVLLLRSLSGDGRLAVVILDDCQWADELSVKLIRRWASSRRSEADDNGATLLVAAFRSEEVRPDHVLRNITPALQLQLPPFGEADLRQLAESMAGSLPVPALDLIERLSAGSPFMASAVLRGMVESKALVADNGQWRIDQSALNDLRSSRHAAGLLARRIDLLPLVAVELLTAAAVLGKEFDVELAANLAGQLSRHAMVALRQARSRHLVWSRSGDEGWSFVHDKVREAFLDRLTVEERQELQRRAAGLLEQSAKPPVFDLAYLFDAAGDSQRALPYALQAADDARAKHSLEISEQQYRIAMRGAAAAADESVRFRVAQGLGEVLMLRGHYEAAAQMFEAAKFIVAELPTARHAKAQIEGKLGEVAFKRGDMQTAAQAIERGLQHLDCWIPKAGDSCLVPLLWEVTIQLLHTLLPGRFVGRRSLTHPDREKDLLAVRLYGRLGHAYWFTREKSPTLWMALRNLNLAERYPPTPELGQAYSEHAPVMSLIPYFRRGEAYACRSLKIRQEQGDLWGQGQSKHYYGIVLYAASRFEDCIRHCRDAVALFQRTGDYWEMNMARYQIAASLYRLGHLAAAAAEARQLHKSGLELGDAQASGIALDVLSWASSGQVPEDPLQQELQRDRYDKQATAQVLVARGVQLLFQRQPGEAVATLQRAMDVVEASGVVNAWVAPVWPWLTTALRQHAESLEHVTPMTRAAILRRADKVARRALRITRKFRNDLPHTLRELALLAAARGHLRRARQLFDRSLQIAQQQGALYECAQTRLQRGRVGREVAWPDAETDLAQGRAEIAELQTGFQAEDSSGVSCRPATLSLVDRFQTVLEVGRQIASALSREEVFQRVQDAALRLLRGERCEIIRLPASAATESPTSPAPPASAAKELVAGALSSGRTVVLRDDADGTPGEVLEAFEVRSALCTPVYVRGTAAACFYVTHDHVSGLFGDDEQRLAEFIAAIAGAALENAGGFADLQRLNATLEQRVAERTADLEARTQELARSNTDLEQFAYVASHDLREPLRTISHYCQQLERRWSSQWADEARDYLTQTAAAAQRMRSLINDLLTYSRVGTRGKPLEPVDCNDVVQLALTNLSLVIEETGAAITCDPLPWVRGDATQLIQLFQNLIANALKFRGDRPPQIHIGVQSPPGECVFAVQDNGIGIAPGDSHRIFAIFQRLHSQQEYPGTGIGLAVCKKTVERHQGRIWVESELGRGSKFCFTLTPCPPGREELTGP
jgi:two-component system sensor kinase